MKNYLKDKKYFKKPDLEIVAFTNEDVIVCSGFGDPDPDPEKGDVLQG